MWYFNLIFYSDSSSILQFASEYSRREGLTLNDVEGLNIEEGD